MRLGAAILLACALAAAGESRAQELVVNGGFESYSRCPTGPGLIDGWLDSWHRTSVASTDFFDACGSFTSPSHAGDGHVGLLVYDFSANYREFVTGHFIAPLQAGHRYRLEMWLLHDSNWTNWVSEIGGYFSDTQPTWPGTTPPAGIVPQVESSTPLSDDVNWTLLSFDYDAVGGEQYLTIGNFRDDASTTVDGRACCGQYGAYYHLDDVSLTDKIVAPSTCLWRADLSSLRPPTPALATLFQPPTADGISIQGTSWQCPFANGDLEQDADALSNGVPLSFYQVNVTGTRLQLRKSGTTIQFYF